jgi:adenylosuccinate synthase
MMAVPYGTDCPELIFQTYLVRAKIQHPLPLNQRSQPSPSINTESLIRQSASTGTPSAANEYEALLKERIEALKGTDLKKQAAIDIMYNIGAGLTSQANLGQALSKGIGGAYESISGRKSQYDDDLLKLTKEKQGIADTRAVRAAAAAKASTPKSSSSSAMLKQITDVKKAMADLLVDDIGAEISPSALTGQDKIMYESLKRQLTALIMSYNMMQGQAGIADLTEPPVSEPLE